MYMPAHFEESRIEEMHRLIAAHPLGILVTSGAEGLDANHLPFEFDARAGVLRAHVARANPLADPRFDGGQVMVIFRGHEGYVSPNWYPSKHETHAQVPTWNYQVVHAHGVLHLRDDVTFLTGLVGRLTRRHERGQAEPWSMGDAPKDFIDRMLQAIVGIEIAVTRIEAKSKLGQNKEDRDRRGAAEGLAQAGKTDLARAMLTAPPDL